MATPPTQSDRAPRDADPRDELAGGLPATGRAPIGETPKLPRPLGNKATEMMTDGDDGSPAPRSDARREQRMLTSGARFLMLGGVLFVLGLIVTLIAEGLPDGIGVALMALAVPPTLAGAGLHLSALVQRRSRRGGSFA